MYLSGYNMMVAILNKEQLAMVAAKAKKPKERIVGGVILWSNQQEADPINHHITSVIVP